MEDTIRLIKVNNEYTDVYTPYFDYHKDLIKIDNEIFKHLSKYEPILKNKNIIDVGSCFGMYSRYFSKITNKKVYCFEPNSFNYNILKYNVNDLENIVLYKKAVGSKKTKTFLMHTNDVNFGQSTYFNMFFFKNHLTSKDISTLKRKNDTDVIPLDSLNLENIGFLKIDVEGFEIDVLKGCKELINNFKPIILIGTHKINNKNTKTEVFKILEFSGYELVKSFDKAEEHIFEYKDNE